LAYAAPALPLGTRALMGVVHRAHMLEILSEDEQDRSSHRAYILSLAGFSFSALLALGLVEATLQAELQLSLYYLVISLVSFLAALNLQSYKGARWQDQVATALMEAATLSLLLAAVSVLFLQDGNRAIAVFAAAAIALVWGGDHLLRVFYQWSHLKGNEDGDRDD